MAEDERGSGMLGRNSGISRPEHIYDKQDPYIVQQQLQDVILAQQAAYDKLKKSIEEKGELIPLKQYETVLKMLEEEQSAHATTRTKLMETEDKLEFALGEVEILQKQISREKAQFEKSFGALKNKALKETCKNVELENKCDKIERVAETTQSTLDKKEEQITTLTEQLNRQSAEYEQEVAELTIQRMQDAYISRTLDSNRTRPSVPRRKPKSSRQKPV